MKTNNPLNGSNDLISERGLTSEEFCQIVQFFYMLKLARDDNYAQSDTLELTNDLNYFDNKIKRQVG